MGKMAGLTRRCGNVVFMCRVTDKCLEFGDSPMPSRRSRPLTWAKKIGCYLCRSRTRDVFCCVRPHEQTVDFGRERRQSELPVNM